MKDTIGWGVGLWLFGYVLGVVLYFIVPPSTIGWVIAPIGGLATWWVLTTRIRATSFEPFVLLAWVWTAIAVVFDYAFIVRLFHPPDGYYKADVYAYYVATAGLPLLVGWLRTRSPAKGTGNRERAA